MRCQTPLCYMSVIHLKAVTVIVNEVFNKTVICDLILTFSEGHRAKRTPPVDCQTPTYYMSVIHLKAVSSIVKEILARYN